MCAQTRSTINVRETTHRISVASRFRSTMRGTSLRPRGRSLPLSLAPNSSRRPECNEIARDGRAGFGTSHLVSSFILASSDANESAGGGDKDGGKSRQSAARRGRDGGGEGRLINHDAQRRRATRDQRTTVFPYRPKTLNGKLHVR